MDEVMVVRRSLRFNPGRFLHKSSFRLSLLSFDEQFIIFHIRHLILLL